MKKKFQISRMYAALIKSAALAIMFCVIAFLIWSTLNSWALAYMITASLIFAMLFAGYIDSMVKPIKVDIMHGSKEQTVEEKAEAVKRYKDVYYVTTTNATSPKHDTSVDGTHPGDHGYSLWAESIQKPILKILRRSGIR